MKKLLWMVLLLYSGLAVTSVVMAQTATPTATPTPTSPIANCWPMYQHDPFHTGQSAFSASAGDLILKWSYATGEDMTGSPALSMGGFIYAGSDDDALYAFSTNGAILWSYVTAGNVSSSPAANDVDIIYVGSGDSRFYSIDSRGELWWSYRTGGGIESSPSIDSSGKVYFGSNDSNIYVLTQAGAFSWSYLRGGAGPSSPAADPQGRVCIGSLDNRIYVYTSAGALSWSYTTGGDTELSPVIGTNGQVFIGSHDNNLYAFATSGILSWSYLHAARIKSSAYNHICNQTASTAGNALTIFDHDTGETYTFLADDIITSAITITSSGYYTFTTAAGTVYTVDCEGTLVSFSDGIYVVSRNGGASNDQLVYTSDDNNMYVLEEGP